MSPRIFFKEINLVNVEERRTEFEKTDYRRKLMEVTFSDGSKWYPKLVEVKKINEMLKECFNHNIQFPDPEKYGCRKQ